jgi:mono/diheme cytochrome c family protein
MLPWGKQLRPVEIANLTAYVASLVGTAPPNPKPPQGKRVQ